jgi:hypothetical protein
MNMPGFTAEASLYTTEEHYQRVKISRMISQAEMVVQAESCMSKCLDDLCWNDYNCEHNCACICYGRPGQTCRIIHE